MRTAISVENVVGIDPCVAANYGTRSLDITVQMTEEQVFLAIDVLLDAGGGDKRAARLAKLVENELTGAHA